MTASHTWPFHPFHSPWSIGLSVEAAHHLLLIWPNFSINLSTGSQPPSPSQPPHSWTVAFRPFQPEPVHRLLLHLPPGEACLVRLVEIQCGCLIGKEGSPGRPWVPFPRIKMFSSFYGLVTTKLTWFGFISYFFEQVQGLGTALKILFSGHELDDGKFNKSSQFHLKRTEIVSLFNAFGR